MELEEINRRSTSSSESQLRFVFIIIRLKTFIINHYKYIVEVLGKTIRRTMMIDHSFERKFHGACYRPRFTIFYRLILNKVHENSEAYVLIFSKKLKYIPKTKKFDCLGRGDLTFLLFSKVLK